MADEVDRPVTIADLLQLEGRLDAKGDARQNDTRRYFDVVAENLKSDFNEVVDKVDATNEKVDRLTTRNAIEHSTKSS